VTTLVRFRAPTGEYALPVEHVTEVRSAADLAPLPAPREGVAGLMRRGDDAVTVLSVLGTPGEHIVVLDEGGLTFGLLVSEVTGVISVTDAEVGPPPPGQDRATVCGVLTGDDGIVLVLDSAALRGRLA
jgi:chemotaxis signal transduction protein